MATAGKIMVFLTLALSCIFTAYALVVFTQSPNWGWDKAKAPKEFGQPVPSELDKRKAALERLAAERARALAALETARKNLALAEKNIAKNQLWYAQELEKVQAGKDFDIKSIQKNDAGLWEKEDADGKPKFGKVVAKKTYENYLTELRGLMVEITKLKDDVDASIVKQKNLTEQLDGATDKMGKKQKGLYALIEVERNVQKRALEELEELKPSYFQELVDSQLLLKRQESLLHRIKQLENLGVAKR